LIATPRRFGRTFSLLFRTDSVNEGQRVKIARSADDNHETTAGTNQMRKDDGDEDVRAPKQSNTIWFVLGGVGAGVLLCCCCFPGGGYFYWDYTKKATAAERQKKVDEEPGTVVTSIDLSKAYLENPVNADAKFTDKVLVVTGRVTAIDATSATLEAGVIPGKITFSGVYCTFSDKNKGDLATLKVNEEVTVKGYCTGTSAFSAGNLLFCKKVK
jgi:hypothetical protein